MDTRYFERRTAHIVRTRRIFYILAAVFAVFALRLWQLQVVEGEEYRRLAENNRIRVEKVTAPRGIIYDRYGTPLVKNVPAFDISVVPEEFSMSNVPLLAGLLTMDPEEIEEKLGARRRFKGEPVKVKIDAEMEEVARVEARRLELPGVHVDVEVSRGYLYGNVASHILGYLGRLRPDQMHKPEFRDVPANTYVGQWGLEEKYDSQLRGVPGDRIFEVTALGQKIREVGVRPPEKGKDIYLTIDLDVQKAAEEAIGDKSGAAVALDPSSGEVLALVSRPSFDPNYFSTGISSDRWDALLHDPRKPLFNRALQSQFPPGSTFKIVVALAALEERIVSLGEEIECKGWIKFGDRIFRCWRRGGHGTVNFRRALVESCDVYFYEMAIRLGIDNIAKYAKALGLGDRPGLGLVPEAAGIVPSIGWKKKRFDQPWYRGETLNASIGQGYVLSSPFQMAEMTAAFSNGGTVYKPRLIRGTPMEVLGQMSFAKEHLAVITDALKGVVEDPHGTAGRVRSEKAPIAGKTGTAQVTSLESWESAEEGKRGKLEDHGWFVAFSPIEEPSIALAVIVEHGGHGGSVAGPVAKAMIEVFDPGRDKIKGCGEKENVDKK